MAKCDLCSEFEQTVWVFLDGDMPERDRIFWERHVASCKPCRAIRDEARAVELAYHGLPGRVPPNHVLSEIRNRVHKPARLWQKLRKHMPARRLWQSSLIGATVILLSILITTFVRHQRSA